MMLFSDPGEVIAGEEVNAFNRSVVARGHTTRVALGVLAVNTFSNMGTNCGKGDQLWCCGYLFVLVVGCVL